MPQQFSLQAQADELGLREREGRENVGKLRPKKPKEMIALMEVRLDVLAEARDSLSWLAKNADAIKSASASKPDEVSPKLGAPLEPETDEWGDPISNP